jgi:hypothetical protein
MNNERKFKTKTGFCHILPDRILLTRDGSIGNVSNAVVGNNITKILLIYGGLSIGLLYFSYDSYKNEKLVQSILFLLVGLYLIYGTINSINNSAALIIDRNKIRDVKFKRGVAGLTRARFEVYFQDENGKIKKRLIMLPGSLSDGQRETEIAIRIMTEENLISNR